MICLGNHRVNFRSKEAMYFKITGDFYDPLEVAYKKRELESELSAVPLKKGFYLREPNTWLCLDICRGACLLFGDEVSQISLESDNVDIWPSIKCSDDNYYSIPKQKLLVHIIWNFNFYSSNVHYWLFHKF